EYLGYSRYSPIVVPLRFLCENDIVNSTSRLSLDVTDTQNEAPTIEIPVPLIQINLDTWQSNTPLTFLKPIVVTDLDLSREFKDVLNKSYQAIIIVTLRQ